MKKSRQHSWGFPSGISWYCLCSIDQFIGIDYPRIVLLLKTAPSLLEPVTAPDSITMAIFNYGKNSSEGANTKQF